MITNQYFLAKQDNNLTIILIKMTTDQYLFQGKQDMRNQLQSNRRAGLLLSPDK